MITRLKRMAEIVSEVLCTGGGLAVMALVLLVSYSSISRYVFGRAVNYMEEVAGLLLMVVSFLSFAYIFVKGGHIRVMLILGQFSGKVREYVEGAYRRLSKSIGPHPTRRGPMPQFVKRIVSPISEAIEEFS